MVILCIAALGVFSYVFRDSINLFFAETANRMINDFDVSKMESTQIISYGIALLILLGLAAFVLIRLKRGKSADIILEELKEQRKPIEEILRRTKHPEKEMPREWIKTNIGGFDQLIDQGIPVGSSVLVAGGAGSGKTIFCLQLLNAAALKNEKCLYISLEESEERLKEHMRDFKWDPDSLEKKGLLIIKRVDPFQIARDVEALLAGAKGELKMDLNEVGRLVPENFAPKWIVLDSLTALASAFKEEEDSYRVYIEQLFRYFESLRVNSFLVSETEQIPIKFSKSGVEEFLADGVIVFYHIRKGDVRERAFEILKMRGATHKEKIVAMQIIRGRGIEIYPEQEIFTEIEEAGVK